MATKICQKQYVKNYIWKNNKDWRGPVAKEDIPLEVDYRTLLLTSMSYPRSLPPPDWTFLPPRRLLTLRA
jgi:hypothetical protein